MRITGLDHVALAVADQERSARWYREVLGLEREFAEEWGDVPVAMMDGESGVALFAAASTGEPPGSVRHVAFRVDAENLARARDHLSDLGIPFESADHGVAHSIYFEDPDGVRLELTTYDVG